MTNHRRNRFNTDRLLSSFHLDHVIQFFNFFSTPFNFCRWYSADCKRLGPPGLPSCSCGLRPQGLGLRSARRAGQQCASARSRNPKVVVMCSNDVFFLLSPIPAEFIPEVHKELRIQRLCPDVCNHLTGLQVHWYNFHILNLVTHSHDS